MQPLSDCVLYADWLMVGREQGNKVLGVLALRSNVQMGALLYIWWMNLSPGGIQATTAKDDAAGARVTAIRLRCFGGKQGTD